jgi:hypothetical protein
MNKDRRRPHSTVVRQAVKQTYTYYTPEDRGVRKDAQLRKGGGRGR